MMNATSILPENKKEGKEKDSLPSGKIYAIL
jgi:hypothetical protein